VVCGLRIGVQQRSSNDALTMQGYNARRVGFFKSSINKMSNPFL
jgi:hypothetical protein